MNEFLFGFAHQTAFQERNVLVDELVRRGQEHQDDPHRQQQHQLQSTSQLQALESHRARLTLLEQKLKEVLTMIRALNRMVIKANE